MASLCTPMMGLSAAIYGPAIGGLIGGSDYNILGPAGALVNILARLVNENGGENGGGQDIIPWVAMFSGIFTLLVFKLKLERYCVLIPNSVLEGFSMGVGITIGCNQLNFAFGLNNEDP
jgi:sulfate permease, SulP family